MGKEEIDLLGRNDVEIICPGIVIFSQFQVLFKQTKLGKTNNKFIYVSIISIQWYTDQFEKKSTNYCIRVRSLVMVRNPLPARLVNLKNCNIF